MKKLISLMTIIMIMIITVGCNSGNDSLHNPDYIYGTYEDGIESVYELTGSTSQYILMDYSDGFDEDSQVSIFVEVSETASGGVVAFCNGIYVYSPDKNDASGVKNALISECMK